MIPKFHDLYPIVFRLRIITTVGSFFNHVQLVIFEVSENESIYDPYLHIFPNRHVLASSGQPPQVTHEWSDGIAATQIRIAVKEGKSGSPDNQWILFDGRSVMEVIAVLRSIAPVSLTAH